MTIHICDFHEPIKEKGGQSCWEFIWSNGKECRKCYQTECVRYKLPKNKLKRVKTHEKVGSNSIP